MQAFLNGVAMVFFHEAMLGMQLKSVLVDEPLNLVPSEQVLDYWGTSNLLALYTTMQGMSMWETITITII